MTNFVKLEGFDALRKRLRSFPEKLRKNYMRGGMRAMVAHLRKRARQRVKSFTGALRRAIGISTRAFQDGTVQGKVFIGPIKSGKLKGRDVWYGHIVEGGAKPHRIPNLHVGRGKGRRLNTKMIAFGGRVFHHVDHPGMRGRYFMRDTASQDVEHGRRLFTDYVESRSREHIQP